MRSQRRRARQGAVDQAAWRGDRRRRGRSAAARAASRRSRRLPGTRRARAGAPSRLARRVDLRVGGDRRPAGGRRRRRAASRSSTSSVSVVLWPGRPRPAGRDRRRGSVAVAQPHVGARTAPTFVADEVPEALVVGDDRLRHAVVAHQRAREAPVRLGPLGVARAVVGQRVERGDRGAGAARDRGGEARRGRGGGASRARARCPRGAARASRSPASSAASASSSRGPVSISVSGSPRSSQALTEPTCGSGSGIWTMSSMS